MITKQVIERLAFGGNVVGERTFPLGFRYAVRSALFPDTMVSEDDVIDMLADKWIAPAPVKWNSDTLSYPVVGLHLVQERATKWTAHGLGFCATCHSIVALTYDHERGTYLLARHGHTKLTPACVGKVPAAMVRNVNQRASSEHTKDDNQEGRPLR